MYCYCYIGLQANGGLTSRSSCIFSVWSWRAHRLIIPLLIHSYAIRNTQIKTWPDHNSNMQWPGKLQGTAYESKSRNIAEYKYVTFYVSRTLFVRNFSSFPYNMEGQMHNTTLWQYQYHISLCVIDYSMKWPALVILLNRNTFLLILWVS